MGVLYTEKYIFHHFDLYFPVDIRYASLSQYPGLHQESLLFRQCELLHS